MSQSCSNSLFFNFKTIPSTEVTISPSSANILNNAGHTITAVYEDITSPYTSLTWTTTPVTTESLSKSSPIVQTIVGGTDRVRRILQTLTPPSQFELANQGYFIDI